MNDALAFSELTEVAEKLRTKALSPVELARAMLDRCGAAPPFRSAAAASAAFI